MNPTLIKSYKAEAAVSPARIVKPGTADSQVVQGAAATDSLMGVSVENVGADIGEQLDVIKSGIATLEFGGSVTRGGPVTCDASGKGVAASPATGANVRIIGFAEVNAVSGDLAPVLVAPGIMQGP